MREKCVTPCLFVGRRVLSTVCITGGSVHSSNKTNIRGNECLQGRFAGMQSTACWRFQGSLLPGVGPWPPNCSAHRHAHRATNSGPYWRYIFSENAVTSTEEIKLCVESTQLTLW